MKKVISIFLTIAIIVTLSPQALAAENQSYHVIHDDSTVRIAEEYINGTKYVYTFSKESQKLTTQTFDSDNTLATSKTICLAEFNIDIPTNDQLAETYSSDHYQHTFLNYEYDQINETRYRLRKKNIQINKYLPEDRDTIDRYVAAVDTLNAAELAVIAASGITIVGTIATLLTSGLTAAEVATAVGVAVADVVTLNLAIDNCERVWELYVEK